MIYDPHTSFASFSDKVDLNCQLKYQAQVKWGIDYHSQGEQYCYISL